MKQYIYVTLLAATLCIESVIPVYHEKTSPDKEWFAYRDVSVSRDGRTYSGFTVRPIKWMMSPEQAKSKFYELVNLYEQDQPVIHVYHEKISPDKEWFTYSDVSVSRDGRTYSGFTLKPMKWMMSPEQAKSKFYELVNLYEKQRYGNALE